MRELTYDEYMERRGNDLKEELWEWLDTAPGTVDIHNIIITDKASWILDQLEEAYETYLSDFWDANDLTDMEGADGC